MTGEAAQKPSILILARDWLDAGRLWPARHDTGLPPLGSTPGYSLCVDAVQALMERIDDRRVLAMGELDESRRSELGLYFTPGRAGTLIAGMPRLPDHGVLRVLDPGAGVGSLSASLVARVLREAPGLRVEIVAVELDEAVAVHLRETLADCASVAAEAGIEVTSTVVTGDLITMATGLGSDAGVFGDLFDLVIMNPPYRKLGLGSSHRLALLGEGVDCPNLYCAFLAAGALRLKPGGQLVAITPRSFANGPYFAGFRQFFLRVMTLDRLHVFESRSTVFADSAVLQENVIFSATRSGKQDDVVLSVSKGHTDQAASRKVPYGHVVRPGDPHQFVHFLADETDTAVAEVFLNLPCVLGDLGVEVSTGRVVDFRARAHLLEWPGAGSVPLIYPGNLREGRVHWPLAIRKAQAIAARPETRNLLLPAGCYVLVKRFSAKEERRRVVAAVYEPEDVSTGAVGFENHLNVFHHAGEGLTEHIALGLCLWLNSSAVDRFFRTFSGHTQVNATDLRSLRYPSRQRLEVLGLALGGASWPDQEKIDSLVSLHVLGHDDAR
jgi:adenine-specific DNA-methyltransferase